MTQNQRPANQSENSNKGANTSKGSFSTKNQFQRKGGSRDDGCWECGEIGHERSTCPRRAARASANTVRVTCLSIKTISPFTLSGEVGNTTVQKMLVDTGADLSLLAEDLVPAGTKMLEPVWVEGIGEQLQLYDTAKVPFNIMGKSTQLLVAIAPTHHIPFAVILGRNVPGLKLIWSVDGKDFVVDGEGCREAETTNKQPKKVSVSFKEPEKLSRLAATAQLSRKQQSPISPNTEDANVPEIRTRLKPNQDHPNMELAQNNNTEDIQSIVAMAVQTRRQAWLAEQQEKEEQEATATSGVQLTPVQHTDSDEDGEELEDSAEDSTEEEEDPEEAASNLGGEARLLEPDAIQQPLAATAPTREAELRQQQHSQATQNPQTKNKHNKRRKNNKTNKTTERKKPDVVVSRKILMEQQAKDEGCKAYLAGETPLPDHYAVRDGILYTKDRSKTGEEDIWLIVLPKTLQEPVLYAAHEAAGHFGANKTKRLVNKHFFWPGMGQQVTKYCKACPVCLQWNARGGAKQPLMPLPVVSTPWTKVAMDVVGPLPRTNDGYRYLLTIIDFGTRFVEAVPLKKVDAESTCQALMGVFACFGVPQEIVSDNGTNFVARVTEELLKHLKCLHIKSSPYHPESNGMVERINGVLKKVIDKIADSEKKTEWKKMLPAVLMALRNADHTALGISPYHLMFGREARTPVAALRETMEEKHPLPQNILDYLNQLYSDYEEIQEIVKRADEKSKKKSKLYYDRSAKDDPLEEGDEVLCMLPAGESGLTCKWEGPYSVLKVLGPLTYLIDKPTPGKAGRRVHRNALKRFICPHRDEEPDPDRWIKAVNVSELDTAQRQDLLQVLTGFEATFTDIPGTAKLPEFSVDTGDKGPTTAKPYNMPLMYVVKAKEELHNMEELGIIVPSISKWSCPVICVPKPNGDVRLCMDYRRLNQITSQDVYPLPNIEHLVQRVAKARFITTMDLTKGYYQLPLRAEDQYKTAFVMTIGKWQFTRMPFGIMNAPAWFQRQMDHILRQLNRSDAYIDDVCVYSNTWEEHINDLRDTLECLRSVSLTVKLSKCCFAKATVQYLGHIIGGGRIAPVEAKVMAITDYQRPVTKKQMQRFLGMAGYYRRFVPGYAESAAPLHDVTGKKAPVQIKWTPERDKAFKQIKQALGEATILVAPDYQQPYLLKTDASGIGIGAALEQQKDNVWRPVAFFSRKLTPVEKRYSASELETLAIIASIKHFGVYLRGAQFKVETDHKALEYIKTLRFGSPKLVRWAGILQEYCCEITYKPGATNVVADALSRSWDAIAQDTAGLSQPCLKANSPSAGRDVESSQHPTSAPHGLCPCYKPRKGKG